MTNQNTAILVFANSAQKDASRKSIGQKSVFSAFNKHTKNVVLNSGLPYVWCSETEQIGHTFGERFTNAIKSVYDKGYDNVITIGNDTPNLSAKQLIQTAHQLKHNSCVLGPSTDGGFYLMGLHKSQFNEQLFLKLPWQSRRLAKRITLLLSAFKVDVFKLKVLQDIDVLDDIKNVLNSFKTQLTKTVKLLILSISIPNDKIGVVTSSFSSSIAVWFAIRFNKGSPIHHSI